MPDEIRALTVRQPIAYLAGVLAGDGYLTKPAKGRRYGILGLHVADEEFARAFADAVYAGFGVAANVNHEKDGYWRAYKYGSDGKFDGLPSFRAQDDDQRAAWLRGFFDAEGNAQLTPLKRGQYSWSRRVVFYNTDLSILGMATENLNGLHIPVIRRAEPNGPGHYGSKTVYRLFVRSSRGAYERFAVSVGSSIRRKQSVLEAIVNSYHPDIGDARRQAGAAGAATKRERASSIRLPLLLDAVARHIAAGGHPGHDALRKMDGYWSARTTLGLTHAEIVQMAEGLRT